MRTPHESVTGIVRDWNDAEGWGVLLTPDGLTVFCDYSLLDVEGSKALTPGSPVRFDFETPGQDGCDARVLSTARPAY